MTNTTVQLTQSKSKMAKARSAQCKFNCITVNFDRTQHGIYIYAIVPLNVKAISLDCSTRL